LADYREHYEEIRAAGATLAGISVDPPEASEALRTQLCLPFTILCDTERRVVQDWDVYNRSEKGGIAKPAVFIIGSDLKVRYVSLDTVSMRVPASEILRILRSTGPVSAARRRVCIPTPGEIFRGIRNLLRFSFRSRRKQ
jgi:peroxiredoxin Q/BCP